MALPIRVQSLSLSPRHLPTVGWRKACLSATPVWIGWVICLDSFTADMQDGKKARLIGFLKSVHGLH